MPLGCNGEEEKGNPEKRVEGRGNSDIASCAWIDGAIGCHRSKIMGVNLFYTSLEAFKLGGKKGVR